MDNHFHVLIRVPRGAREISNVELVRRYRVLYPKPTAYQTMAPHVLEGILAKGGSEAKVVRSELLKRMGDLSEYMKALKHRFSSRLYGIDKELSDISSKRPIAKMDTI